MDRQGKLVREENLVYRVFLDQMECQETLEILENMDSKEIKDP